MAMNAFKLGTRVRMARRPEILDRRFWPQNGAVGTIVDPHFKRYTTDDCYVEWDGAKPVHTSFCLSEWLEAE